ncbi:MAG: hypothetical protein GY711_19270 [bacterium]|nr:hypothetical protein [bacterium]
MFAHVGIAVARFKERPLESLARIVVKPVQRIRVRPEALDEDRGQYARELSQDNRPLAIGQALVDRALENSDLRR